MKNLAIKSLIALLVSFVTAFICSFPAVQDFEDGLADIWFSLRGKLPPPRDLAIIAIDERSYDQLKVPMSQGWPRILQARLLEKLSEYGVRRVVFDILFIDASADSEADQRLAAAIGKVPTVLGIESSMQQVSGPGGSYVIEDLLSPYDPFLKAAAGTGLVGLPSDQGIIRRFLTERSEQTAELPSLSEAGAGMLPTDGAPRPGARDLINYYGPARTIPIYSFYQVLDEEKSLPAQALKDKIVYVGLLLRTEIGPAQKDIFRAPFGGNIFGVEVHAAGAGNLIDQSWIRRSGSTTEIVEAALLLFLVTLAVLVVSPIRGAVLVVVTALIWAVASFLLFRSGFFLPGVVPVLILSPLVLLLVTLYYYLVIRRSEQSMRSAFELYLSPDMVKSLKSSGSASLGGEKLWATALFTDIAGFTAITEEMPAERVAQMLNDYFTEVMEVVFQNQGTLIKFIGDAVFVLWGAPLKVPNHAERAVQTALAIEAEVRKFNDSGRFPALHTRIGINTGPMLVGNLGSRRRFDYTAIGDSVNLASRIEGINKYLGTTILFTEATRRDAGDSITALRVGAVRVSGKKEVVNLFTSFREMPGAGVRQLWTDALEFFAARDWGQAQQRFAQVEQQAPLLAEACVRYRKMIETLIDQPPEQGWNGELIFKEK